MVAEYTTYTSTKLKINNMKIEIKKVLELIENQEAPAKSNYDLEALHEGYFMALQELENKIKQLSDE